MRQLPSFEEYLKQLEASFETLQKLCEENEGSFSDLFSTPPTGPNLDFHQACLDAFQQELQFQLIRGFMLEIWKVLYSGSQRESPGFNYMKKLTPYQRSLCNRLFNEFSPDSKIRFSHAVFVNIMSMAYTGVCDKMWMRKYGFSLLRNLLKRLPLTSKPTVNLMFDAKANELLPWRGSLFTKQELQDLNEDTYFRISARPLEVRVLTNAQGGTKYWLCLGVDMPRTLRPIPFMEVSYLVTSPCKEQRYKLNRARLSEYYQASSSLLKVPFPEALTKIVVEYIS